MAQVYTNGPINGNTNAWTINFGFAVSDTFTTSGGSLTGLQFGVWLFPGDVLQSVEVLIGTSEYANDITDQTVSITQSSNCPANNFGFMVCTETGSLTGVAPGAGTDWLTLQNAVVSDGDPVFWDENSGPSLASHTTVGTIPSEAFTVFGSTISTTSTTPEPSSIMLFGSGILGLAGMLRRRWH
jgi:hypothetical protein